MNDLIKALLASSVSDEAQDKLPSIEDQKKTLQLIAEKGVPKFKIGQFVERNEYGVNRYRFPAKNQIGIITTLFDTPMLDEDGRIIHGEVTCLHEKEKISTFTVDFRYYKPVLRSVS